MKLSFLNRILLFVFALSCTSAYAQDNAPIVKQDKKAMTAQMSEFKWTEPSKPSEEKMAVFIDLVKAKVSETIAASGRFELLEDEKVEQISAKFQDEAFMNLPPEQYRKIITDEMNDYLISGEVTKCKFTKRTTGANGYLCMLSIKLDVTKAYDKANTISSRIFVSNFKSKKLIVRNTPEAALDDALQSMTEKLINYFSNNFSVYGIISSYEGNKAVVTCGSPQGIKEGDEFQVLHITVSKGNQTIEHVGKLKVKELLPDGTSVCNMTENKEGIIQQFQNSSNQSWLQCRLILN